MLLLVNENTFTFFSLYLHISLDVYIFYKNATIRFIKYWKERIWLWGEDKAFRKITINDFDDEDQVALLLGGYRICPSFDKFERGVIISDRNKFDLRPTHRKSQVR